ncbi:MAG: ATP-binding protein [Chlamydiia bacterium]|nr:ATP-binding protein [Chlamydiia bacterium]
MQFVADLSHLTQMMQFIRDRAHSYSIPDAVIGKIELAAEEAIVNIISYAYRDISSKDKQIMIHCTKREDGAFEVSVRDGGIPFNPLKFESEVDMHKPLNERKIGGLGIYLMEQLMDEVSYFRDEEENVLRLIKYL